MTEPSWSARLIRLPGEEIGRFLAAVQYFTRLPVPAWVGHSQQQLDDAARYFPLVGVVVGGMGAAVLAAAHQVWTMPVAVTLSMIATLWVTGGFHEDGLADTVDGLGGSFSRDRALEIMKDSRIGAFGAMALVTVLVLKFALLSAMTAEQAVWVMIGGHAASRWGAVLIMASLPYVRETETSRSKPLVQGVAPITWLIATVTTLVTVTLLGMRGVIAMGATLAVSLWWRRRLHVRLGGYTGDCLGAAQQLGECAFYLACSAASVHG